MRNTLILVGQIKTNRDEGLDTFHAVVEATVQRSRPVVLTALAAVLAFIPLTFSAFWDPWRTPSLAEPPLARSSRLSFLPALYSIWFRVKPQNLSNEITQVPASERQPTSRISKRNRSRSKQKRR